LSTALLEAGDTVVALTRTPGAGSRRPQDALPPGVREVAWTPDGSSGPWARELTDAAVVVNLAGAGIADARWTPQRKELLRSSRVLSTRSLVGAVRDQKTRPAVFIQHCAIGIYGATLDDRIVDESAPPASDFLGQLAVAWEAEAAPVVALGCRLVTVRAGVVLERDGGALPQMLMPFRLFVGGPVASGNQYLSWIHVDDWVKLVVWAIQNPDVSGALNATSPEPVTNREFSKALARASHRPSWASVPGFVLRTLFGEMADAVLIKGQRAVPRRAQELGFGFAHPAIDEAVEHLLNR
jgi:uncharacterized protein (TIGR01777 family)